MPTILVYGKKQPELKNLLKIKLGENFSNEIE